MAAPAYTEDLTDIDTGLAESTTGYVAYGGGASGLGAGADFAMQGTNCVDKQITNAEKGILYNKGAGVTIPAGDHVFIWQFTATPGVCNTLALRGVVINVGSGTGAFCKYHVDGGDTFGAGGRVGKCYPIDPSVYTANTGAIPYRTLVGTPSGVFQYFGSGLSTNATVKSANMGLDAQRYGTGAYLTAGELISAGDASDDPCTFAGFATQNDAVANRWGIFNELNELQGMFAIGQNNAGVATLARFEDSDVNIKFVDTPHCAADFTQIVVDHASTVCNLTNINLEAEGTINKGRFIVNANNPTVSIIGGTWTGIGIITLQSNTTTTGTTFRRCALITGNGATMTGGTVESSTASSAILIDTNTEMAIVTGVGFVDNSKTVDIYDVPVTLATSSLYSGSTTQVSQSFIGDGNEIGGVTFNLSKTGSPTGNATAYLYAHSGTYGTSSVPTGSALATSNTFDISTLTGSENPVTFDFPTEFTTVLGTEYTVVLEYAGGDGINNVVYEVDISGTHGGNKALFSGSWAATAAHDVIFALIAMSSSIELTATGSHDFTDITFSGGGGTQGSNLVASTGAGDADVYNNSGGAITINVSGGDSPSVRNAAGSTTTVVSTVTLTVTDVPTGVNMTIVNSTTRTELQHTTSTGANITYSHSGGETVDILFMANDYDPNSGDIYDLTLPTANSSIKANIADDLNYENP